ncbi:MAG: T9SS type A sorting domain-containing protein [Bacteroidetes bacterium]|nr:T9SS type A sorting domain-containing protein [Bacteroidota bacterium]
MKSNRCTNIVESILLTLTILIVSACSATAQIKGLSVETYYIADVNDITDNTGGRSLSLGAKTYRIYVELESGSKLRKIYGDSLHPLSIYSDSVFYNNNDRPSNEFGYEIQASWYEDNPTLALDSWFTLGLATKTHKGIMKSKDTDGDIIAGINNLGGTASIPGGLLVNNDPSMGIPLTTDDGIVPNTGVLGSWIDVGFKDAFGNDTTIFGADSLGNEFKCYGCALQQTLGIEGPSQDSNRVLVAQLTTGGELKFEINLTLEQTDINGNVILIDYVATDDTLRPGEVVSPFLSYPLACGCTDPRYLEYSGSFTCLESDSCKTLIVFGCMDTLACNYKPEANFNMSSLCCYPGYCNDLDIALVCPSLNLGRFASSNVLVYPNPSYGPLTVELFSKVKQKATMEVYNTMGALVYADVIVLSEDVTLSNHDINFLQDGVYFVRVVADQLNESIRIVKKNNTK